MLKKPILYSVFLLLGAIFLASFFLFHTVLSKPVGGILLGWGIGFLCLWVSHVEQQAGYKKNPSKQRQDEIDYQDERNTRIREMAKAKAGDMTKWLVIALVYVMILCNAPLVLSLLGVGIFVVHHILYACFTARYQKEF